MPQPTPPEPTDERATPPASDESEREVTDEVPRERLRDPDYAPTSDFRIPRF